LARRFTVVTVWEYSPGDVFLSMLWFFLFFIWIWLLISVFGDIFRSDDLSGWAKAFWTIFVVILPWLGILVYLIARGSGMQKRALDQAQAQAAQFQDYVRQTTGGAAGTADELAKLAELRDKGALTEAEFAAQKAKLLS
jgi:hypothetical protein